jgi:hypothetical protein
MILKYNEEKAKMINGKTCRYVQNSVAQIDYSNSTELDLMR